MKKIIILAIALPILFSCSKKWEGCTDFYALNFEKKAEKDDGSCIYSSLTFYADSTNYGGVPLDRIDITIDRLMLGSFSTIFPSGWPVDCNATGTLTHNFTGAGLVQWKSEVYLSNGSKSTISGTAQPDSAETCILIKVF